jgi:hypothetical protein
MDERVFRMMYLLQCFEQIPEFQRFVFALGALLWDCCFYNPHSHDVFLDNLLPGVTSARRRNTSHAIE